MAIHLTQNTHTMLDKHLIQQLAHELNQSEKSRVQIEHFSKRYPGMTIEDGYRINRAWMQLKFAEGRTMIGHKIGLTSRAMQVSSQIDEPDYGTLLDDMLYTCTPGQVLDIPFTDFMIARYVDDRLRSRVSGMRLGVSFAVSSLSVWALGPVVKAMGFGSSLLLLAGFSVVTALILTLLPSAAHEQALTPTPST